MGPTARHWIGTVTEHDFSPGPILDGLRYLRGQLEVGQGGFRHWQLYAIFTGPVRLAGVVRKFGAGHWEQTRSKASRDYVWKDDTAVEGTRFQYGEIPFDRTEKANWQQVVADAKAGNLESIPDDLFVRYYANFVRISGDFSKPVARDCRVQVFWGRSGTGKSMRAFGEAGDGSYVKDPLTKWWCGYKGEKRVIIDEFRGIIAISHLLRWFDRYPVRVETKGASRALLAEEFWITSNLSPEQWYPEVDLETMNALKRRLNITHFL